MRYRSIGVVVWSLLTCLVALPGVSDAQLAGKKVNTTRLDMKTLLRNAEREALASPDLDRKLGMLVDIGKMQLKVGERNNAGETFLHLLSAVQTLLQKGEQDYYCQSCVEGLVKTNQTQNAYALTAKLKQGDAQNMAYYCLGATQAEKGDEAGVRHTLTLCRDGRTQAEVLASLAEYAGHKGQKTRVVALWEEIQQLSDRLTNPLEKDFVLGVIVQHQVEAGEIEAALRTANTIAKKDDQARAWIRVAQAQALNDIATARQTLAKILDADTRDTGMADVVDTLLKARKVNDAQQAIAQISSPLRIAEAWIATADAQIEANDKTAAVQSLNKAKPQALRIDNRYLMAEPLIKIAEGQARCGQKEAAAQTFAQAQDKIQLIPKPDIRDSSTLWLALAQCRLGNMKECMALVKTLRFDNQSWALFLMCEEQLALRHYGKVQPLLAAGKAVWHPEALRQTSAKAYMQAGDADKALAQVTESTSPGERANAWLGMAEGLWEREHLDDKQRKRR